MPKVEESNQEKTEVGFSVDSDTELKRKQDKLQKEIDIGLERKRIEEEQKQEWLKNSPFTDWAEFIKSKRQKSLDNFFEDSEEEEEEEREKLYKKFENTLLNPSKQKLKAVPKYCDLWVKKLQKKESFEQESSNNCCPIL